MLFKSNTLRRLLSPFILFLDIFTWKQDKNTDEEKRTV